MEEKEKYGNRGDRHILSVTFTQVLPSAAHRGEKKIEVETGGGANAVESVCKKGSNRKKKVPRGRDTGGKGERGEVKKKKQEGKGDGSHRLDEVAPCPQQLLLSLVAPNIGSGDGGASV